MQKPTELWLLVWRDADGTAGYLMPSSADDHGGEARLAYPNEREAKAAAEFQRKAYGADCEPFRVL